MRNIIANCVTCHRLRGPIEQQKMSDLPRFQLDNTMPPFSYTGVDCFGPFLVKDGIKEIKRYGVIFTCLVSRVVHLEVASMLDTHSCVNDPLRFTARRGNVKQIHNENGTNFVGAEEDLKAALVEMDQDRIESCLQRHEIHWSFNPPSASYMGGVWERCIRCVRKVLAGLLSELITR